MLWHKLAAIATVPYALQGVAAAHGRGLTVHTVLPRAGGSGGQSSMLSHGEPSRSSVPGVMVLAQVQLLVWVSDGEGEEGTHCATPCPALWTRVTLQRDKTRDGGTNHNRGRRRQPCDW